MNKWLSDEELWLAENGDEKGVDLGQLFDQAKEANRLREGLKEIEYTLERAHKMPSFYAARLDRLLASIRWLLEGEK